MQLDFYINTSAFETILGTEKVEDKRCLGEGGSRAVVGKHLCPGLEGNPAEPPNGTGTLLSVPPD